MNRFVTATPMSLKQSVSGDAVLVGHHYDQYETPDPQGGGESTPRPQEDVYEELQMEKLATIDVPTQTDIREGHSDLERDQPTTAETRRNVRELILMFDGANQTLQRAIEAPELEAFVEELTLDAADEDDEKLLLSSDNSEERSDSSASSNDTGINSSLSVSLTHELETNKIVLNLPQTNHEEAPQEKSKRPQERTRVYKSSARTIDRGVSASRTNGGRLRETVSNCSISSLEYARRLRALTPNRSPSPSKTPERSRFPSNTRNANPEMHFGPRQSRKKTPTANENAAAEHMPRATTPLRKRGTDQAGYPVPRCALLQPRNQSGSETSVRSNGSQSKRGMMTGVGSNTQTNRTKENVPWGRGTKPVKTFCREDSVKKGTQLVRNVSKEKSNVKTEYRVMNHVRSRSQTPSSPDSRTPSSPDSQAPSSLEPQTPSSAESQTSGSPGQSLGSPAAEIQARPGAGEPSEVTPVVEKPEPSSRLSFIFVRVPKSLALGFLFLPFYLFRVLLSLTPPFGHRNLTTEERQAPAEQSEVVGLNVASPESTPGAQPNRKRQLVIRFAIVAAVVVALAAFFSVDFCKCMSKAWETYCSLV